MFKIALCQIKGSFEKEKSMETAADYVVHAAENGAQVISLPEMWNCPYSVSYTHLMKVTRYSLIVRDAGRGLHLMKWLRDIKK